MVKADALLVHSGKDQSKISVISEGRSAPKIEMKRKLPLPPPFIVSSTYSPEYPWMGQPRPVPKVTSWTSIAKTVLLVLVVMALVSVLFYCGHRLIKWKSENDKAKEVMQGVSPRVAFLGQAHDHTPSLRKDQEMLIAQPDSEMDSEEDLSGVNSTGPESESDSEIPSESVSSDELDNAVLVRNSSKESEDASEPKQLDEKQRRGVLLIMRLLELMRRQRLLEERVREFQEMQRRLQEQQQQDQEQEPEEQQQDQQQDPEEQQQQEATHQAALEEKDVVEQDSTSDNSVGSEQLTQPEDQHDPQEQLDERLVLARHRVALLQHLLNERQKQLQARQQQQRALAFLRLLDLRRQEADEEAEHARLLEEQREAEERLRVMQQLVQAGQLEAPEQEQPPQEEAEGQARPVMVVIRHREGVVFGHNPSIDVDHQEYQQDAQDLPFPVVAQNQDQDASSEEEGEHRPVVLMIRQQQGVMFQPQPEDQEQQQPEDSKEQNAGEDGRSRFVHFFLMFRGQPEESAPAASEWQQSDQEDDQPPQSEEEQQQAEPELQEAEQQNLDADQPPPLLIRFLRLFREKQRQQQLEYQSQQELLHQQGSQQDPQDQDGQPEEVPSQGDAPVEPTAHES